jgi:SAM-dependent methyltransferase
MARFSEAYTFLSSFRNLDAQEFVRELMKNSYASAVLRHHPSPKRLSSDEIQNKCNDLVDYIFDQLNALEDPRALFTLFKNLSRTSSEQKDIWFDEFLEAYQHYKHQTKLENRYQQLKPYIYGPSYCDVGCGGGDLVAYMKHHHPDVNEAAGIDVLDWRSDSVRDAIDFQMLDLTQPGVSSRKAFDTLTCLAVLHHIDNRNDSLDYFLTNLKTAMKPGGRLVIEEDVILPEAEIKQDETVKNQVDKARDQQPVFTGFLEFDQQTQRDIITIIDFLSNTIVVGVLEMPFPCSFQTLEGWRTIFEEKGFVTDEIKVEGLVPHRFNQSSHVIFVLRK